MSEIGLELVRVAALAAALGILLVARQRGWLDGQRGWGHIAAGLGLLLFGSVLDLTKNFDGLSRFVVIGDTAAESALENVVGYLAGFTLLFLGLWHLLPLERVKRLARLDSKRFAHSGRLPIAVVLCLGTTLSAVGYFWTFRLHVQEHTTHAINGAAVPRVALTHKAIDRHLEVVQAISGLYAASNNVDRGEFRAFVQRSFSRNPGIQALEWIPRVRRGERAAYRVQAQLDGHVNFRIRERNSAGEMVPAAPRDEYYPVYFVEPLRGNEPALGFDLGSNPARLAALNRARDTGQAVATQKITLVQESGSQAGFLIFVPFYSTGEIPPTVEARRRYLSGFALGVFRIGDMVEAAMQEASESTEFDVYLMDESAEPGARLLHYLPAEHEHDPSEPLAEDELYKRAGYAASVEVAGRKWRMLFESSGHRLDSHSYTMPWGIAGSGFLLTLMLAQYLVWSRDRTRVVEQLVDERSQELTAANSSLKAEIAGRERMEAALRVSERRFAGILDIAQEAIISVDESGCIRMFNQGAEQIFGYAPGELLGQAIERLMPARFRAGHGKLVEQFAASSEVARRMDRRGQIVGLRKDGSEFPAEASVSRLVSDGETIFTVMLHDITERMQMEGELRASEMRIRAIVDNSPAAISMKDLDGRFLLMNDRFREWYCASGPEPIGLTSHDFYPKEQADRFAALDRQAVETLEVAESEIDVVYADGSTHSVVTTKFPIFDAENRVIGIGGIATDVTDQRQAEQQIRQNTKMEALGTLAGGIAHDLNNVLVPVLGLTKLTINQMPEQSQARTNLEKVVEASNRARELVKQILAFSRADQPERTPVSLESMASEVMTFMRSAIPTSIEIRLNIEPDVGTVLADSTQIHQVIMNLASNARHAMKDKNGVLELGLARVELDAGFAVDDAELAPGPYARLTVRDTGKGMDAETKNRIFDPFFTTKAVGEGTGMGLAVVHGIVTRHGGAITVSSKKGRGTTFEIYLPIWQADETGLDAAPEAEAVA